MLSYCFKTKASFGFYHQLLLKLSRVRAKRNKKALFRDNFFRDNFGNLEIDFGIN